VFLFTLLLDQLRKAVILQVELWDVRLALSDTLEHALKGVDDQRAIGRRTIDLLLNEDRNATALNAELQHVIQAISSGLECDLDYVASQIQAMGVTADSGLELVAADLDEFLGLGRKRTTHAGPLRPTIKPSNLTDLTSGARRRFTAQSSGSVDGIRCRA
jgi:hypothetical protein